MFTWIPIRAIGLRHLAALVMIGCSTAGAAAQGFKFEADPGNAVDRARPAADALSTDCARLIKGQKIMVIIGEQQATGRVNAAQQNYGPHFQAINARLRALGASTFTPEELQRRIAQAEVDAYFRNDPDAALLASRRLGAQLILRGLITSQTAVNPVLQVNQVSVGMGFTLVAAGGRTLANAHAAASSYAGVDVRAMAQTLLDEQADDVLLQLFASYCQAARVPQNGQIAPQRR